MNPDVETNFNPGGRMNLDRSIAVVLFVLALCFLPAAASAQARTPSSIASVRQVPAAAASPAPTSLDPSTVLAYTQQQLAKRDRELQQQMKQQQQRAKNDGAQQRGKGVQSGKDTEIDMLKLQSNVSERSKLVQLSTNLIKSQAPAASAARNIGH